MDPELLAEVSSPARSGVPPGELREVGGEGEEGAALICPRIASQPARKRATPSARGGGMATRVGCTWRSCDTERSRVRERVPGGTIELVTSCASGRSP